LRNLDKYPVKILLAFDKAIQGENQFFEWLLENGFPELAALANAIRANTNAIDWLMANGYVHYAAFDAASVALTGTCGIVTSPPKALWPAINGKLKFRILKIVLLKLQIIC